jgi:N-acetylglucosamine-6-phosphate deacetylase
MSDNLSQRFVDLQINGYAGVDFNADNLSAERLHFACERLKEDCVTGILATIVTAALPLMTARLGRIAEISAHDPKVAEMIWGLHVEGPFINETRGFVGAHPPQDVLPGNVEQMKILLDAGCGLVRLVTLAPERDPGMQVTRWLAEQNVIVSAGHSDASLAELCAAIDAGLTLFTHLGNGCPMLLHRHDNIIQRVLSLRDRLTICFIADGVHVPAATLGNYLQLAGVERSVVVTDAISAARLGPGRYQLGGQSIDVGDDLVARSADASHFVGSTTTMPRTAGVLREQLGLSKDDIHLLTYRNPCRVLGLEAG